MKVYHRTDAANSIERDGFRDGRGNYMTDSKFVGVWVSDAPLDENEGTKGDDLFEIEIPEEVFVEYEWVNELPPGVTSSYREALIPAAVLNKYRPRQESSL